jgi:hypothetical protein
VANISCLVRYLERFDAVLGLQILHGKRNSSSEACCHRTAGTALARAVRMAKS